MQLTRRHEGWDPVREIDDLSSRVSRMLGMPRWSGDAGKESLASADWFPSCDISESDKDYCIRAELPNVKKEDVHVRLDGGILTIEGESREQKEEKGVRYHRREMSYGHFVRRFSTPADVDEGHIDAAFRDGILEVTLAKSKGKEAKGREISVKS